MKIKALDTFETTRFLPEEDEHGVFTMRPDKLEMKEGDIREVDDKLAKRLIGYGHASEDLEAETRTQRLQREAPEQ
jgi:hypothetical protein